MITHRFILRLAIELRPPLCVQEKRLVGHIDLKVGSYSGDGGAAVCALLAQQGYHSGLGARSIEMIVNRRITMPLIEDFWEGQEINDAVMNKEQRMRYSIDHSSTGEQDQQAIIIRRLGIDEPRDKM